jgi:bacterial/archaeal transporter family-2 protein
VSGSALATVLAITAGLAGSVQVAVMSRLGERIGVGEALGFATLVSAALAFVGLLLVRRSVSGHERALHQPWWVLSGGAFGLFIVFTVTYAGPRIGVAATVGILIAGQLVMGAVIDRWVLFGSERIALHCRACSASRSSPSAPRSRCGSEPVRAGRRGRAQRAEGDAVRAGLLRDLLRRPVRQSPRGLLPARVAHSGRMFWLTLKTFSGSYCALTRASLG